MIQLNHENGWSSESGTSGDFFETYDLGESVKSVASLESTN